MPTKQSERPLPMITSRERLKILMSGEIPDCVPVCPDTSNMIPARMTGKPFWDVYLKQDPPPWKAYIDAVKFFGYDGGYECSVPFDFGEAPSGDRWSEKIVERLPDGSFFTRQLNLNTGEWSRHLRYLTADNPPGTGILPETVGLPETPSTWEDPEGIKDWPKGIDLWRLYKKELGENGVAGFWLSTTNIVGSAEGVCEYFDNPEKFRKKRDDMLDSIERRMNYIASMPKEDWPDILFCGGSGSLIWQTPETFRELGLPVLKKAARMAHDLGIPTHVHSCGPERELVKMAAEETLLTIIDPLEIAPKGDCNLAELKRLYGSKLILKGNLHTTDLMLNGSKVDVVNASKKAIDDGAKGGRFILSTGDQCGRDTPDENIFAMIETSRTYGKY